MRTLDWFQERLNKKVVLDRYDLPTSKTYKMYRIINSSNLFYFMDIQDDFNTFSDPFLDDKPVLRIHQGNQEECEACSS